ncbi:hypothetical protein Q664_33260 [Archangium violaceum Cb vi76]|uniref:Uncharacterized protein n=1 Tax=Archangium violaceum Cb vi76 TaxID=1406225 RepID=A0A084SMR9_9BACT|nr:hypothetical protein Q664_33260 [Archangium violaceum Cb vi76]
MVFSQSATAGARESSTREEVAEEGGAVTHPMGNTSSSAAQILERALGAACERVSGNSLFRLMRGLSSFYSQ